METHHTNISCQKLSAPFPLIMVWRSFFWKWNLRRNTQETWMKYQDSLQHQMLVLILKVSFPFPKFYFSLKESTAFTFFLYLWKLWVCSKFHKYTQIIKSAALILIHIQTLQLISSFAKLGKVINVLTYLDSEPHSKSR